MGREPDRRRIGREQVLARQSAADKESHALLEARYRDEVEARGKAERIRRDAEGVVTAMREQQVGEKQVQAPSRVPGGAAGGEELSRGFTLPNLGGRGRVGT